MNSHTTDTTIFRIAWIQVEKTTNDSDPAIGLQPKTHRQLGYLLYSTLVSIADTRRDDDDPEQ